MPKEKGSIMADELDCNYHRNRVDPINRNASAAFFRKIKINGHYGRVLPSLCSEHGGYKYSLICHDSAHQTTESIVSSSARDVLLVISICIILLLLMVIFALHYKRRADQNAAMRISKDFEAKVGTTEKVLGSGNDNV